MLLKNHDNDLNKNAVLNLDDIFSQTKINSILYSDPFLKSGFLAKLIQDTEIDILYLDLDLMYSGYLASEMLTTKQNLILFQPILESWNQILTDVLVKLSNKQSIVVIDSLNGLYNILNEKKNVGRLVTSCMMLIASMAKKTNSYILVASMVRFKKEEGWILSPTGKRFIETAMANKILLEQNESGIILNFLNVKKKTVIPSNTIPL